MYTYVITDGVALKVGRSTDVDQRVRQLQTGNPRPLEVVAVMVGDHETRVHRCLDHHRISGEWFANTARARNLLRILGFQIPGSDPETPGHLDARISIEEGTVYGGDL